MENDISLRDKKGFKITVIAILAMLFFISFILGLTKGTLEVEVKRIFEVISKDDGDRKSVV